MNTLLITYQLDNFKTSYPIISQKIKEYPNWAKPFSRVWLIKTNQKASDVRSELSALIPGDNKLLVINITGRAWASYHLEQDVVVWMKEQI